MNVAWTSRRRESSERRASLSPSLKRCGTIFTALILSLGLLTPTALTGASESADTTHDSRFLDIDEAPSHASAIEALDRQDVLIGTECGIRRFCPNEPLERWVMAVWLIRALGQNFDLGSGGDVFDDVDHTLWWAPFADHLATLGITRGCATDPARFCPDDHVTRGQMASFLTRAYTLAPAESAGFTDTQDDPHANDIDSLAHSGITRGCALDPLRFCPTASVTRAEMASFLVRAQTETQPASPQMRIAFTRNMGTRIYVMNADGTNHRPLTTSDSWEPAWSPDGTKIAYIRRSYTESFHIPLFQPDQYSRSVREGQIWVMDADGTNQVKLADEGAYPVWSPDSSQVAFSDGYRLYLARADGTDTSRIATRARNPSWSPDGSRIVFEGTGGEIYVTAADGSTSQLLRNRGASPVWSPDGTKIAYDNPTSDDGGIYIMNPDGTGIQQLTYDDGQNPQWSRDGTRIIYEGYGVTVMNRDGTGRQRLTSHDGYGPVFSPGGERVAYSEPRSGIQVMDADGTDRKRLTTDHHGEDPTWSPDGTLIAYTRDIGYRVFTIGVDSRDERQLTPGPYDFNPVWSSNGRHIAFSHNHFFDPGISVIDSDGNRRQRLTVGRSDGKQVWSPDSRKIAYSNIEGLWVINANGSDRQRLFGREYTYPDVTWSPDGTRIAYTDHGIWIMEADGTNRRQLTAGYGTEPSWSPDGTRIAFINWGLWVIDVDGTNERQLASDYSMSPAWSPDSTRIAYETIQGASTGIGVINADGTDRRLITTDQGTAPVWSPDGSRIAYSRSFSRGGIFIVNSDGTGQVTLTERDDFSPSWSPVPVP